MNEYVNTMLVVNYGESSTAAFVGVRNQRFIYARGYKNRDMTDVPKQVKVSVGKCPVCNHNSEMKMEIRTITATSKADSQIESIAAFPKKIEEAIEKAIEELSKWQKRNMFQK